MTWICPTFQRPERLAELAVSWDRCQPGKRLYVRVWDQDPRKEDYFRITWPEGWELYESPAEWCGDALEEFYQEHPGEENYGFIADDIVLRTPGGLEKLELLAGEWGLAYPNDMIQRNVLATHFCIGKKLVKAAGFLVPRGMKHNYLDVVWMNIAVNTGALRYCPDVIFQHKHFLRGQAEKDSTYSRIYNDDWSQVSAMEEEGLACLREFEKKDLLKIVNRIRKRQRDEFEQVLTWEEEDESLCSALA